MTTALRALMKIVSRALVDVAVLPEALQTRARLRIDSRRIARPDAHHPARELLLADDLVHVAVKDELDAFFTRAELQRSGERGAVRARARARRCGHRSMKRGAKWLELTPASLRPVPRPFPP